MSDISNITPATSPIFKNQLGEQLAYTSAVNPLPAIQTNSLKESSSQPLNAEAVKAAAVAGNAILQESSNKDLQFQVDDVTKQVIVKVVDSKTGEVVRQIPTVEMLDFIRAMKEQETNSGKLYQAKA